MTQKKLFIGGIIVVLAAAAAWWFFSAGPLGEPTGEKAAQEALKEFVEKAQSIPIGAGPGPLAEKLQENYGGLVDPALLEQWSGAPLEILGRPTDDLWADRVEIESTEEEEPGKYRVTGTLIAVEPDDESGETAGTRLISVIVENRNEAWIITDVLLGDYD